MQTPYKALLLDLDGTLIGPSGLPHPRTTEAVRRLVAGGVYVMIATGRSEAGTIPILDHLELRHPALVFNGAGIWCPERKRLLEERTLSDRKVARVFDFALANDMCMIAMQAGQKFARHPKSEGEARCLHNLEGLHLVEETELPRERLMRMTLFSEVYTDSYAMLADVEAAVGNPVYYTNFPLNALYEHLGSKYQVVDVQPPCRGKAEALRFLHDTRGILPTEVVAIGDATNDLPMLEACGLAVAMENAMQATLEVADRIIGTADTDTIAELAEELWPECFGLERSASARA